MFWALRLCRCSGTLLDFFFLFFLPCHPAGRLTSHGRKTWSKPKRRALVQDALSHDWLQGYARGGRGFFLMQKLAKNIPMFFKYTYSSSHCFIIGVRRGRDKRWMVQNGRLRVLRPGRTGPRAWKGEGPDPPAFWETGNKWTQWCWSSRIFVKEQNYLLYF